MVINKLDDFWTDDLRREKEAIRKRLQRMVEENIDDTPGKSFEALVIRMEAIDQEVLDAYRAAKTDNEIFQDAKDILAAVTKEDFRQNFLKPRTNTYETLKSGMGEKDTAVLQWATIEGYETYSYYLMGTVGYQRILLKDNPDLKKKILGLIDEKIAEWLRKGVDYVHNNATDAIPSISPKRAVVTNNAGKSQIKLGDVVMYFDKLPQFGGTSAHKLLVMALGKLTEKNDFKQTRETGKFQLSVDIPMSEYARLEGYDLTERETSTPEEAAKEKKRINNLRDQIKKDADRDIRRIGGNPLSWTSKVKGKSKNYYNVFILSGSATKDGYIRIKFNPDFLESLAWQNTLTHYPDALFTIDDRNANAYRIGNKLSLHFYMDSNQVRGNCNRIKVKSLLDVTDLPSYETVMSEANRSWRGRIKTPFEQALTVLKGEKEKDGHNKRVIKDWAYIDESGKEITSKEAESFSFTDWENLYVRFEMFESIVDMDRINENQKRREEKEAKRQKQIETAKGKTAAKKIKNETVKE